MLQDEDMKGLSSFAKNMNNYHDDDIMMNANYHEEPI